MTEFQSLALLGHVQAAAAPPCLVLAAAATVPQKDIRMECVPVIALAPWLDLCSILK